MTLDRGRLVMSWRGMGRFAAVSILAVAALGCAAGAVTGSVAVKGQPSAPLVMHWNSGLFGESGKMSATMPDGEQFTGTYQVVKPGMSRSKLEPAWTGDEPGEDQGRIDDTMWGAGRDTRSLIRKYENKAVATV